MTSFDDKGATGATGVKGDMGVKGPTLAMRAEMFKARGGEVAAANQIAAATSTINLLTATLRDLSPVEVRWVLRRMDGLKEALLHCEREVARREKQLAAIALAPAASCSN